MFCAKSCLLRQLFVFLIMKRVSFQTLGCKLNFAETSTIGRQFTDRGFEIVGAGDRTDVFVLNTCTVTQRADRECRQLIRRALRRSPNAYVIVVGCYAQLQPEEIASIDGVDLVIGSNDKFNIFRYTDRFEKNNLPQIFVSCIDEETDFHPAYSAEVGGRTRAFLKIQDGCDYNCAFCTIPRARGASRSNLPENIVAQAQIIADQGYKEIVLTGVNVGDYGKNIGIPFLDLLKALDRLNSIPRIRISSIEPNILSEALIDFILSSERFCNHFHIPLQSGSNTILKRMRRRYTTQVYEKIVSRIRQIDPGAGIGADVIVGFPGETDELFSETFNFIQSIPASYLHVFTYSARPHTPAANLDNQVDPKIQIHRNKVLHELGASKRHDFHTSILGKSLPVLFEGKDVGSEISGLTPSYVRVAVLRGELLVNQIQPVTIMHDAGEYCNGKLSEPDQNIIRSAIKQAV
jgi:threonylcarbamoyladenosine tRNA methylthiotransferase MtaB